MLKAKYKCQSAVIGSNVYNVTDDKHFDSDRSIEVLSNNNWKRLTSIPYHKKEFSLCSFMQQLFSSVVPFAELEIIIFIIEKSEILFI